MNPRRPEAWDVVTVSSPSLSRTSQEVPAVAHSEWVRLLLGRALASARVVGEIEAPHEVQYLVTGIPAGALSESVHRAAASSAVEADLAAIEDSINYHRRDIGRVAQEGWHTHAERFVAAYALLTAVTVSIDPADWIATDEGLFVVRWGLVGPQFRPLLRFSPQDFDTIRSSLMARLAQPVVARTLSESSRFSLVARQAVLESGFRPTKDLAASQQVVAPTPTPIARGARSGGPKDRLLGLPAPVFTRVVSDRQKVDSFLQRWHVLPAAATLLVVVALLVVWRFRVAHQRELEIVNGSVASAGTKSKDLEAYSKKIVTYVKKGDPWNVVPALQELSKDDPVARDLQTLASLALDADKQKKAEQGWWTNIVNKVLEADIGQTANAMSDVVSEVNKSSRATPELKSKFERWKNAQEPLVKAEWLRKAAEYAHARDEMKWIDAVQHLNPDASPPRNYHQIWTEITQLQDVDHPICGVLELGDGGALRLVVDPRKLAPQEALELVVVANQKWDVVGTTNGNVPKFTNKKKGGYFAGQIVFTQKTLAGPDAPTNPAVPQSPVLPSPPGGGSNQPPTVPTNPPVGGKTNEP